MTDPQPAPLVSAGDTRIIRRVLGGFAVLVLGILIGQCSMAGKGGPAPAFAPDEAAPTPVVTAAFAPPAEDSIPTGADGDAIRRGKAIFDDPRVAAAGHVGNALACRNCHLDSGRRANSSPMWAAWGAYPQYRRKNKQINTMEMRIRDCFTYSMNAPASKSGVAPLLGDPVYADMMAYFHWLATGAPSGVKLQGAGYAKLAKPKGGYDRERGRQVFAANCAICHGANGAGQRDTDGKVLYPPLWGRESFNWGAGMARVDMAAAFVKANMPLGNEGSLTEQQAWDVAAWIDSQERPRDPRQTGSIEAASQAFHTGEETFYGVVVDGRRLGAGTGR